MGETQAVGAAKEAESPISQRFTFLENFIATNFSKMPSAVRVIVYLVMVALFVYGTVRLLNGNYAVRGTVVRKTTQGNVPVSEYDVRVGERFYGVNSNGVFYVVLDTTHYWDLWRHKVLSVKLSHKGDSLYVGPMEVNFDRTDHELSDIYVPEPTTNAVVIEPEAGWSLVPRARAGVVLQPYNRLFLTAVRIAGVPAKEGVWEFFQGSRTYPSLAVELGGDKSGPLPIQPGQNLVLGPRYYFPFQSYVGTQMLSGELRFQALGGWKSEYENFRLADVGRVPAVGERFKVRGDKGSEIELRILSPYDVVLFRKADVERSAESLDDALLSQGFLPQHRDLRAGEGVDTSLVIAGSAVPFTAVQQVIGALKQSGIVLKRVQYHAATKSGRPNMIEVSGPAELSAAPALSAPVLDRLLQAKDETQFIAALSGPRLSAKAISTASKKEQIASRKKAVSKAPAKSAIKKQ